MNTPSTSIRLTADERELLDSIAAYQSAKHGLKLNRSSTVKHMLRRFKPPDEQGKEAARWRRAYTTVFGMES